MASSTDAGTARGTAYDSDQFADNYPDGIERHYWNVCRNRLVAGLLDAHARGASVLEIGCGRGVVVDYLRGGGTDAWGCDLGAAPPLSDRVAPFLFLERDAFALDEEVRGSAQVLLLLDVLEHIEEPVSFLTRCASAFESAHTLIITLPARSELWSNYDDRFGHFRRYDPASVSALLEVAGIEAIDTGYFFHALYAPMRIVSMLGRDRRTQVVAPSGRLSVALHRTLGRLFAAEARLAPRWLPGSSIYAVARL